MQGDPTFSPNKDGTWSRRGRLKTETRRRPTNVSSQSRLKRSRAHPGHTILHQQPKLTYALLIAYERLAGRIRIAGYIQTK